MLEVKEDRIRNETVRERFFNIPHIRNMIAARQLSYLGKLLDIQIQTTSQNNY